jgi:RHS repeat-associated protein
VTYVGKPAKVEYSQVLWSGWLPVMEDRYLNQTKIGRRWFQWGADRSGSLEGAGGIGGIVAILEEDASGTPLRTLLPVEDGLGNIMAVVDANTNQTVARYDYGPFGEPLGESGESGEIDACPFRYQTKFYDKECQHYYFGYRHYDPRMGRWLSRDPMGEAGGFNLYAYCGNDPVNRFDYLGMDEQKAESREQKILRKISKFVEKKDAAFNKMDREMGNAVDGINKFSKGKKRLEANLARGYDLLDAGMDREFTGTAGQFGLELTRGLTDPFRGLMSAPVADNRPLWERVAGGEFSSFGIDPTKNPRFVTGVGASEVMGVLGLRIFDDAPSAPLIRQPNIETLEEAVRGYVRSYRYSDNIPDFAFGMAQPSGLSSARRLSAFELETGRRLEAVLGKPLQESPHEGAEYVDSSGRTYDQIGHPGASLHWNSKRFLRSIDSHLLKSNDFTVIDMTWFTPTQIAEVEQYLSGLSEQQLARIIKIGF